LGLSGRNGAVIASAVIFLVIGLIFLPSPFPNMLASGLPPSQSKLATATFVANSTLYDELTGQYVYGPSFPATIGITYLSSLPILANQPVEMNISIEAYGYLRDRNLTTAMITFDGTVNPNGYNFESYTSWLTVKQNLTIEGLQTGEYGITGLANATFPNAGTYSVSIEMAYRNHLFLGNTPQFIVVGSSNSILGNRATSITVGVAFMVLAASVLLLFREKPVNDKTESDKDNPKEG
jgi:hypothetical protein